MESLNKDCIFEFNPDTLIYLRKQYNLDSPSQIEEAISGLQEWINKQPHFLKKDFPKDYLERTIIISKGSVEKAKKKLDRICTFRTVCPDFFGVHNVHKYELLNDLYGVFLPKITKDHYRVFAIKNGGKKYPNGFADFYRFLWMAIRTHCLYKLFYFQQFEYIQAYDYCNGLIILIDYTEANIMETVKCLNPVNMIDATTTIREGYGMRIRELHLLSGSKAIEAIVTLLKQVLSQKLIGRIHVHKTIDSVYEFIPKEILPVEYGGKEKSLLQLHEECKNALTSKEFSDYLREMNKARTNESLRQGDNNHEYMGTQGTFRTLNVD